MKLDKIVAWYQKKIGTYDKQLWEKTVEQKILDGFGGNVTLKNAKLKTELIDVDLVRGSTFPKAKSKQTLITVIRLAILRYFLLPLYAQWWVKQTSPNTFALIFFLYITQMVNWAIFMFNINRLEASTCCHQAPAELSSERINETGTINNFGSSSAKYVDADKQANEHIVSLSELLIPMTLSLLISLIHSQIVATNSTATAGTNKKRRRYSNANVIGGKPASRESRPRRRKKLVKIRQPEVVDVMHIVSNTLLPKRANINPKKPGCAVTGIETLANSQSQQDMDTVACSFMKSNTTTQITSTNSEEVFLTTTAITTLHPTIVETTTTTATATRKPTQLDLKNVLTDSNNTNNNQLRKRNVNWHSSLHDSTTSTIETYETEEKTLPQTRSIATQAAILSSSSSSAQTSRTNSETTTPILNEVNNEMQQDTIKCTTTEQESPSAGPSHLQPSGVYSKRRNLGEDDGFESLNGKSSSGEDNHSPLPTSNSTNNASTATATVGNNTSNQEKQNTGQSSNQLRLRLNVVNADKKPTGRITAATSSDETDEEDDDGDMISSPASACNNECTTSATEWLGITTNSEDCCSYSSELDQSDGFKNHAITDEENCELDFTPTTILNAHGSTDRISCTVWEQRDIKKAQMSVLEISSCIIERVESMAETNDYIYIGLCFSLLLSLIPTFCRLCEVTLDSDKTNDINYFDLPMLLWEKASFSFYTIFRFAFGNTQWERAVLIIAFVQRLCLTLILFIIFGVAERTFKQRFLYAKLFSHLTSSRRARKSNLPHFRLNKVRNIKTWLSVRSYLKKRGPQRSVDIIVSAAFIVTLLLLAFLSVEWLKDSVHLHSQLNLEALMWSITIGIFLLRFMTLGNKIHQKYRSISVLITEQINLYLQIEQKPKKKDELMVSNSVLKLAADLLKELETPFKISGLSANPYLFTTIKVVILSALSGVLSEVLGFKLKLHKIKIK